MAEHESAFAAAVAAVRPLLLGGTIRDAERIVLAALRAANAAGGAELAAANERAEKAEVLIGKLRTDRDHCFAREVSKGLEARQMRRERDEARELACVSLDILRNVSDEPMRELYEVDDMGELPDWFTGYGKPSDAVTADAAQDGRSATETDADGSQAHGDGSNSSTTAAGPSETCGNKLDYHMCFLPAGHDGDHRDSFNWTWMTHLGTWPDDETEAEQ